MKKIIVIGLVIFIIVGFGALFMTNDEERVSEADLRVKFSCDRITADTLATDIYCQNPDYYFDDLENQSIIGPNDFDDPRYEALFESTNRTESELECLKQYYETKEKHPDWLVEPCLDEFGNHIF